MSRAIARFVYGAAFDESPYPRRSGQTTVWYGASRGRDLMPGRVGARVSVQEHHRWPLAAVADTQRRAGAAIHKVERKAGKERHPVTRTRQTPSQSRWCPRTSFVWTSV